MSTRLQNRPSGQNRELKAPAFGGRDSELGRLIWRNVQPLLLRSAGVAGLAGTILAVISSESLYVSSEAPKPPELMTEVSAEVPAVSAAPIRRADVSSPVRKIEVASIDEGQPIPTLQRLDWDQKFAHAGSSSALSGSGFVAPPSPARVNAPEAPASADAGGPEAFASVADPTLPATAPDQDAAGESSAEPASSVWQEEAVACPREWVEVRDASTSKASIECRASVEPPVAIAMLPDQSALDQAAAERASELTATLLAPRVPVARPDAPPAVKKVAARSVGRGGKLGAAPNCGSKRARWHYTDRKRGLREWYCK